MCNERAVGTADEGAIAVTTIAGVALIITAVALILPLCVGIAVRHSVAAAADAAALAASDTSLGAIPGVPCDRAQETALMNGAELAACEIDTLTSCATVTARRHYFGVEIAVRARAEPQHTANPVQL